MAATNLSFAAYLAQRLEGTGISLERFPVISSRLLANGVLWRAWSAPEARLYDEACLIEDLLRETFGAAGMVLAHDVDATIFRLYPPNDDGDDEMTARLRVRLSREFIYCALALRFIYGEAMTGSREMGANEECAVSVEELSNITAHLLNHSLPSSVVERRLLLGELQKYRLIRFSSNDTAGEMDSVISVVRPVLSFVSPEILERAMTRANENAVGSAQDTSEAGV